ncbi:MAG: SprT-like domain-containing protein [Desulfurivibrio sp.]
MGRTTLIQAWQRQLVREHQNICHYYRIALPTPLFEIGEGKSRAGSWSPHPEPGIINIAGWLIRQHSWDVVLEVLKHEICHQYVASCCPRVQEPPHGPAFRRACELLGVHPDLRRAQGEIPRRLDQANAAPPPRPPLMTRVEKLLALATSANEHEAALAMGKAGELMRKHNLARLAASDSPPPTDHYDYLVIDSGRTRRAPHHNHLAAILRDFFYVRTVSYQLYQPAGDCHHRVLELLGAKENLLVAEYVYHFLEEQLARLWDRFRQSNRDRVSGREKNSYYLGILNGLREKLAGGEIRPGKPATRPQRAAPGAGVVAPPTSSQLICAADRGLQQFHDQRYPRLRSTRGRGVRLYDTSYRAGKQEGRRLTIHKGLRQPDGNRGKLLD